jgi:voltage-gated sodium channel
MLDPSNVPAQRVGSGAAPPPRARDQVSAWISHPRFQATIIGLILVNAAILGLETWPAAMAAAGDLLRALDAFILGVFVIEIALRIYAHRAAFWRDPWSVFDFTVVAIALVPASGPFAVLRALRVLRVLRLLTVVPSMRRVVGALLAAIPGLGSIGLVLAIIFYVFAVIGTNLFAETHPQWFGSLGSTLYTLFQVMTLESWSMGISRPVMEEHPYAWLFFVTFILVATFTMLNLFIAIIVNAMQSYQETEREETVHAVHEAQDHIEGELHAEMKSLRAEMAQLKTLLERRPVRDDASGA